MTRSPHSVAHDQSLQAAYDVMRRYGIRYLPVLEAGKLAGILSQRDINLVESIPGIDPRRTRVAEAMSQEIYCVHPDARVEEVALDMAEHKYGCAVVMAGSRVLGIFTTTDALRALSKLRVDLEPPSR